MGNGKNALPRSHVPNSQFPITYYLLPIPQFPIPNYLLDISEKSQYPCLTELQTSDRLRLATPVSTQKSGLETFLVDNKAKNSIYVHQFFPRLCQLFYNGKTKAPILSLTSPHIVIIIFSYLRGFNLNLSEATLNIFNTRIKCSTKIRDEAISLF